MKVNMPLKKETKMKLNTYASIWVHVATARDKHCMIPGYRFFSKYILLDGPVDWGYRIHTLHLCRKVRLPINNCSGHNSKQSDCEAPVMLELWGMQSTPSLQLLPGPLWPGVVAPDSILSRVQIELFYI